MTGYDLLGKIRELEGKRRRLMEDGNAAYFAGDGVETKCERRLFREADALTVKIKAIETQLRGCII